MTLYVSRHFFMLCISARSHRAAERTNNLLIALSLMRNVPALSIQLIAKTKVPKNRRRKPTPLQFPSQTSPQYGPTFKRHYSIYNLVRYGSATGTEGWIPGAEVPFIGADGFCSPVGSSWESRVTSEFGYRSDPFTGQTKGHTGIDIAVPTGTPVRAALPGVVTKATYNAGGYGYYVMIDHGNGMVTLYAHNSKLLVSVGDTVEAGDTVSLSGSTGRSTGPHLHFEVRVNGQRVNPRSYLPTN